ncbi:class I SAM-dependent methyltransferase [Lysobacter sp. 5GHs7-4]|uniref:class I SAM-dependent methyltransferase n=1 Tax=Lysobacter sp. 5GHs7-4 TaxID=2904253 RepID=UPI001E40DAC8|nr:class I SAM-dependent methyltransferase [Lysobacter sp. 5GHs7-4]UHQ25003.1 class I SAM-dependent methyltransferase [Lysobacter sp. 5GHs7-4]
MSAAQTGKTQTHQWNGASGCAWVEAQELLDGMYRPLQDLLLQAVPEGGVERVLDVGCGTGSVVLAAAQRLGREGECTGIDISEPMIALARERALAVGSSAHFVVADAQTHAFAAAQFDLILSRFGLMFFNDPVQAFSNLLHATRPGGALCAVVWRGAADNPFMTAAERAAAPLLPELPVRPSQGPGQFAFADPAQVRTILGAGGWSDIDIRPVEVECRFPASELSYYLSRLGPVGLALQAVDEATRARVLDSVRGAFDPYLQGAYVRFVAACWQVRARRASR